MKNIILTSVGVFLIFQLFACDVCGGVNTSGGMGFAPTNDFHFIGIRSNYRRFNSQGHSILTGKTNSTEYFFLTDIVGKFQLSKRWQLMGILPYSFVTQNENSSRTTQAGIGDISLLAFFSPIIQVDSTGKLKSQLNAGVGVKTPTGDYATDAHTMSNMYPGTGAYDLTISMNYLWQKEKFGFQFEASETYRFENNYGFQYGNILNLGLNYFRVLSKNSKLFRPFVGVQANQFSKDRINGKIVSESVNHGFTLNGKIGLNYVQSNWFFAVSGQLPIIQSLGDGDVNQKEAVQVSINYLISKKYKK